MACLGTSIAQPNSISVPESFLNAFDSLYMKNLPPEVPGGSILVMKGDEVIFSKAYGLADLETRSPNTPQTVYNTGSISKTFVATGILMLAEEGKLSLEDPLLMYFPQMKSPEIGKKVTLRHMLSHTSGLKDSRGISDSTEHYLTADDWDNWSPILANDSLVFEPGAQFEYSNPAYNGLALVIEQVSGQPWREFIQERIFDVVGMPLSTITDVQHPTRGVAHAYLYDEEEEVYNEADFGEIPTWNAAGNGGVWSTTEELAKYENALRAGTLLNLELFTEARTAWQPDNWESPESPGIGLSWFVDYHDGWCQYYPQAEFPSSLSVGHTGSQGGFSSFYIAFPEYDLTYIALFNSPIKPHSLFVMCGGMDILQQYDWLQDY